MENCLTYALRMAKYGKTSDHILIRKSHYGWFPHFAVIFELQNGDIEKREYIPTKPVRKWFPPLFFKGVERVTYYRKEK